MNVPRVALADLGDSLTKLLLIGIVGGAGLALALLPLPWAAALVVGGAALLVVLLRPHYGLYLLIFAIPFGSLKEIGVGGFTVGATELLVALTLTAWPAQRMARRELGIETTPLMLPMTLFLGVILLSLTAARSLPLALKETLKWLELFIAYFLVVNGLPEREAGAMVALLLLAGAVEALVGLGGSLLRMGPPSFAILGGRLYRACGTFGQPNPFGGYINLSLPLALSLLVGTALTSRTENREPKTKALHFFVLCSVFLVLAVALILSWSRGAWLSAGVAMAVVAAAWFWSLIASQSSAGWAQQMRGRALGLLWLGLTLGSLLVLEGALDHLPLTVRARLGSGIEELTTLDVSNAAVTDENFATIERLAHWQAALGMWGDYPWLGVGIGNYTAAYPQYALPRWDDPLGHAHNYYLNIAAETGLVGLVAYLLFLAAAFWQAWRASLHTSHPLARGVAIGVLGLLTALSIHSLSDNLYVHGMGIQVGIALGLVHLVARQSDEGEVSSEYFGGKGGHVGVASIRRLSRPSGRIETQDASGSTDNPLGLDTSLRSYSTGAGFVLPRLFEKIRREDP
jgi:putative inorganic carbon (HCO3(-)) transporter